MPSAFHPQYPGVLLALFLPAVAAVAILIRRGGSTLPAWRRLARALPVLLVTTLIILAASNPRFILYTFPQATIVYLVDISESTKFTPPEIISERFNALRKTIRTALINGNTTPFQDASKDFLPIILPHDEKAPIHTAKEFPDERFILFGKTAEVLNVSQNAPELDLASIIAEIRKASRQYDEDEHTTPASPTTQLDMSHRLESPVVQIDTSATNLSEAIALAVSLARPHLSAPPPPSKIPVRQNQPYIEIVLFTDGRAFTEQMMRASTSLAAASISPIVIPIGKSPECDARFLKAYVPDIVRIGEPFDARIYFAFNSNTPGSVALFEGCTFIASQHFAPNDQTVTFESLTLLKEGHQTFKVVIHVAGDEEPRNNVGFFSVEARGRDRITILSDAQSHAGDLASMLDAAGMEVRRISAGDSHPDDIIGQDGVVLWKVSKDSIPVSVLESITTQVEENGMGLLVVLGPQGFSWNDAEFLPVSVLEPPPTDETPQEPKPSSIPPVLPPGPQRIELPSVALFLLIDKSGSMTGERIQLAKEAAIAAAETLKKEDTIAVIAFDSEPHWVVRPTSAANIEKVKSLISRLVTGGGTHLYPALELAGERLAALDASIKHILIFSDGYTLLADFHSLTTSLAEKKITVSCIGIGEHFDSHLLSNISKWGRGAFYFTTDPSEVPQIFTLEVKRIDVLRKKIAEAERAPKTQEHQDVADSHIRAPSEAPTAELKNEGIPDAVADSTPSELTQAVDVPPPEQDPTQKKEFRIFPALSCPALKGLDTAVMPPLNGVTKCQQKENAIVSLVSYENLPILSHWRYGAGNVVVWTSSFTGSWASLWNDWPLRQRLLTQLVRFILPVRAIYDRPTLTFSSEGDVGIIVADLESEGLLLSGEHRLTATLKVGNKAPQPLTLHRDSLWQFSTRFPIVSFGRPHRIEIEYSNDGQTRYTLTRIFYPPYNPEISDFGIVMSSLEKFTQQTGGMLAPQNWTDETTNEFVSSLTSYLQRKYDVRPAYFEIYPIFLIAALLLLPVVAYISRRS